MAIKVKLREKKISNGMKSLYLDFYPAIPHHKTGKPTRREFLNLYIVEMPKNPLDKKHNIEIIKIGESIRQKRENLLNKPEIYNEFEKEQLKIKELGEHCFVEYFRRLANKRNGSNYDNWQSTLKYLVSFTNGSIKFSELNQKTFEDFKDYLLNSKSNRSPKSNLSQNSAASYFNKIKATLKQAFIDGVLQIDLNAKIKPIKPKETRREFLTEEELNKLYKTPFKNELLKRASFFSALTGIRFSDIKKMTWGELVYIEEQGNFIRFTQQKTGSIEEYPINEQAVSFLGTRGESNEPIFKGLIYSAYNNKLLKQWVKEAGINKEITFHCFRHSFATIQLFKGTDYFTISKMLGHKDLKTTQIYTKVVDESKRKASNKIKLDM